MFTYPAQSSRLNCLVHNLDRPPGSRGQYLLSHLATVPRNCMATVVLELELRAPRADFEPEPKAPPRAVRTGVEASVTRSPYVLSRLRAAVFAPVCSFCRANPPSRRFVTSGGRLASLVSSLPAGTGVDGTGRGRRVCASPLPLLSSLLPFPSLGGGRSPVADSLTRP